MEYSDLLGVVVDSENHNCNISGQYDNVHKYWEGIAIKTAIRRPILELLQKKESLKIIDLACGYGGGYELLTHIPPVNKVTIQRDYVLDNSRISRYLGIDKFHSSIKSARHFYSERKNIEFKTIELNKNFNFLADEKFDIYFSAYSSLSFLLENEVSALVDTILKVNEDDFLLVLDLSGKYSPQWPTHWDESRYELEQSKGKWSNFLSALSKKNPQKHSIHLWDVEDLSNQITIIAKSYKRNISIEFFDRAILVGRHMESGFYNQHPLNLRTEVNKLFDRDYRGKVEELYANISFLDSLKNKFPNQYKRIADYTSLWDSTISFLEALINNKTESLSRIIDEVPENLKEELLMLKWLEGNSSRFPVVDFWASVMGPQVACVLRNLEMGLGNGIGVGDGLLCTVLVSK